MVALHGDAGDTKSFINRAVALAISGALEAEEGGVTKQRVEADVATLHYVLLQGSPFELSDESRMEAEARREKLDDFVSKAGKPKPAPFVSQPTFQGAYPGFVFKTGNLGLGYYHEAWNRAAEACYVRAPSAVAEEAEEAAPIDPKLREVLDERHQRGGDSTASLDRAMAKASMLAAVASGGGGDAMDEMD